MADKELADRTEIIMEGLKARTLRRTKDSNPYAAGSDERDAWNEGFDGEKPGAGRDPPLDSTTD